MATFRLVGYDAIQARETHPELVTIRSRSDDACLCSVQAAREIAAWNSTDVYADVRVPRIDRESLYNTLEIIKTAAAAGDCMCDEYVTFSLVNGKISIVDYNEVATYDSLTLTICNPYIFGTVYFGDGGYWVNTCLAFAIMEDWILKYALRIEPDMETAEPAANVAQSNFQKS